MMFPLLLEPVMLTRSLGAVAPKPQAMVPPPQQAMDPICAGLVDFLDGWVLVPFLRTCKAARCQMQAAGMREAKQQMMHFNEFLAQAVQD